MVKEITGTVQQNPIMLENCCVFAVDEEEVSYLIISTDRQAGKDNIFVEKGQEICVKGSFLEDKRFQGVVITKQAEIRIDRNAIGQSHAIVECGERIRRIKDDE